MTNLLANNPLAVIGRVILEFTAGIGRVAIFTFHGVRHVFAPPVYLRLVGRQMMVIGYFSLPVVGLTALFTGMVLALQIYLGRSEEHTSELQSLMRISYAVFCLKKKKS